MPTEPPVIQSATIDDFESIARLHFLSHTVSFAPFASEDWLNSRRLDQYLGKWREILERTGDNGSTFVARTGRETVGMVRVARPDVPPSEPDEIRVELTGMHVSPKVTGQGIGTLLMRRALEYIDEQRFSRVVLGVIAANTGARRFYERHGWALFEEFPSGVEGVPVAIYELT